MRRVMAVPAAVMVAALAAACGSEAVAGRDASATLARSRAVAGRDASATLARSRAVARPGTYYRLVQYPAAGLRGLYGQIAHARATIDMEMYELADTTAERDLEAAARRGVRVRVLLDRDYTGGMVNERAYSLLRAHGVQVRWAPAGYIFHIKATTFDARTSDISTANLTSRYYATSRDAEIVDSDPRQVRAIEATFDRDWAAGPSGAPGVQTVGAPGLVWSPDTGGGTAETALATEIRAARHSVDFESEELADPAIIGALAADARRGVDCRIVMTRSEEWAHAFDTVTRAGCHVRVFADEPSALYIHEKLIVDDATRADRSMFLGSQNASVTSLTRNRELGIIVRSGHGGRRAIGQAAATFDSDFTHASPWPAPSRSPRPTPKPTPTPSPPTQASCHPLSSTGHCYRAGEYCSAADHGMHGVAGDGEPIVCTDNDGWRWEPA